MNNISTIITEIYNNMIKIILSDIEANYHKVVCQKYMEILVNRYSNIVFDETSTEKVYNCLYKIEYDEWSLMTSAMKKHIFISDDSLKKIIDLASVAFKCAKDKLDNSVIISKEFADKNIEELNELYNNVEEFNKNLAMWYISKATVDFDYASNQTEAMSSEISHLKDNNAKFL